MTDAPIAPFLIAPHYDTRIWGYEDLHPWFDQVATGQPIGEVWLTGDQCLAATGPLTGQSLGILFEKYPQALLGPDVTAPGSPLLIKVLFARQKLSVQVHPDDKMAQKYGDPRGKTECWYTLAAGDNANIALGLKPDVTLDQVKAGIHDGTLEDSLNVVTVHAGDMVFVDAGTVHAIWPGAILLETQQNCDLTYRMFDYGRPRELHIEKSLEATKLTTRAGKISPVELTDRTVLIDVEYFRVDRIPVSGFRSSESLPAKLESTPGLSYLFAAAGSARLNSGNIFDPVHISPRGIVCVPASSPEFQVEDLGGLDLIRIAPNWPKI